MKVRKKIKFRWKWKLKVAGAILGVGLSTWMIGNGIYGKDIVQFVAGIALQFTSLVFFAYTLMTPDFEVMKIVEEG